MHAEENNGYEGLVKPKLLVNPLDHIVAKLVMALTCDHERALTNLRLIVVNVLKVTYPSAIMV